LPAAINGSLVWTCAVHFADFRSNYGSHHALIYKVLAWLRQRAKLHQRQTSNEPQAKSEANLKSSCFGFIAKPLFERQLFYNRDL
jgi:hypothetical protein